MDSLALWAWCWVSESECWCLLGWPFCLLSSCVVDGSPVSRDEKWCCCLSHHCLSLSSCHLYSHLHPLTHPLPLCPPLLSTLHSHLFCLSHSLFIFASLSVSSPPPISSQEVSGGLKHHGEFQNGVSWLSLSLSLILSSHLSLPLPSSPHLSPPSPSAPRAFWTQCLEQRLVLI